ncbi:MAG: pyrroloquinoline quinone precursor peptide PqqA [Pseudomonadota bacterium]
MAWSKPKTKEIACGMEINMYAPGEDDTRDTGETRDRT